MSDIKDDTHDLLTKAYLEYFKASEAFEARNSVRTHGAFENGCEKYVHQLKNAWKKYTTSTKP